MIILTNNLYSHNMSFFNNMIIKNLEIIMNKLTINIPKLKQRVVWNMKPTTRVKQSKKIYSRKNWRTI